jgi:hypothetical protein
VARSDVGPAVKLNKKYLKWGAIGLGALVVLWWLSTRLSGTSASGGGMQLTPVGSPGGGGLSSGDQASVFNTLAQVQGASEIASIQAAIEKIRADAATEAARINGNTQVQLENRAASASTVNTAIGVAGNVITSYINSQNRPPVYVGGGGYGGYQGGGFSGVSL